MCWKYLLFYEFVTCFSNITFGSLRGSHVGKRSALTLLHKVRHREKVGDTQRGRIQQVVKSFVNQVFEDVGKRQGAVSMWHWKRRQGCKLSPSLGGVKGVNNSCGNAFCLTVFKEGCYSSLETRISAPLNVVSPSTAWELKRCWLIVSADFVDYISMTLFCSDKVRYVTTKERKLKKCLFTLLS